MGPIYYMYLVNVMKTKAERNILSLKEEKNGTRFTSPVAHKYA